MRVTIKSSKIAVYLPSLRGGGAERVILALANGFASDDIQVDLVLADAKGPYLRDVLPDVRIIDLRAERVLKSLPGLIRYLRREHPDAILTAMTHANIVAILAIWLSGIKTRLVISERVDISDLKKSENFLKRVIMTWLMRITYHNAYRLVAVSKGVASGIIDLVKLSPEFVDVIYNPVNIKRIEALSREIPTHPWFHDGITPIIISAGRLSEQKDFALLIRAFAELRKDMIAKLIIIGEGEERENLTNLINVLGMEADISLPGFVENPHSWMKASSLFVLSSRWEGLPNALIEALACGVPVISTDCPSGPAEILENGKWGKLVPVGGQKELAAAMAQSLRNPKPAPVESLQKFAIKIAIAKYRALLVD